MTAPSYFTLSCDSYKQIIFSGFTRLQEQQEFVDLTLAADGHIVKVHKNIMALASPYIKELLKSTSSHNPIIFLNNVPHNVLNYLLEYIYQGEVNVPQDSLESFLQLSQSLHIAGMGNPTNPTPKKADEADSKNQSLKKKMQQKRCPTITIDGTHKDNERVATNVAARITINNDHNFEVKQFDNIQILNAGNFHSNLNNDDGQNVTSADTHNYNQVMPIAENHKQATPVAENYNLAIPVAETYSQTIPKADNYNQVMPVAENYENGIENTGNIMALDITLCQDENEQSKEKILQPTIRILNDEIVHPVGVPTEELNLSNMKTFVNREACDALKIITQYTVTERGSVQIIVSRYIYCSHHTSRGGRKQRWRCIDYRNERCLAFIDSFDGRIIARKGVHCHGFHDDKIYQKHAKSKIFHSYKEAKESWTMCTDLVVDDNED